MKRTLHFEWDDLKAAANARKHGVSFDEARSVFVDERAKLIDDPSITLKTKSALFSLV
jgi:uncharacterized DUF497 family protein